MAVTKEQQLGRAKNAILTLLERRLSVPKIYIDAIWGGSHVDVLAINRDGGGDVHAVLLFPQERLGHALQDIVNEARRIEEHLKTFEGIPAQYKYVAVADVNPTSMPYRFSLSSSMAEKTFAHDGLGRVGFVTVETPEDEEPTAQLIIKPERFRAKVADIADEYVREHSPDWEMRV